MACKGDEMKNENLGSAYCGQNTTHVKRRPDAVIIKGRELVPTVWGEKEGNTIWIDGLADMFRVGGIMTNNEDQTEVWLTLPPGHKFGCGAFKPEIAANKLLEALILADAALSGANMNMNVVKKKVKAAIAAGRGES